MKRNRWTKIAAWSLAAGLLCALATTPARAQSEASAALSLLPVLTDGRTHAVIIVDDDYRILGLISQTDLLSAVARLLPNDSAPIPAVA